MARRPNVQSDRDDWGAVLNDYLDVSLNEDGTIKDDAAAALPISDATDSLFREMRPSIVFPRRHIAPTAHTPVTTFAPGHGWTVYGSGSITDDATDGMLAEQTARVETDVSNGFADVVKGGFALDLSTNLLQLYVRIENPADLAALTVYAGDDVTPTANAYNKKYTTVDMLRPHGEWQVLTVDFTSGRERGTWGTPDMSNVAELRVRAQAIDPGTPVTVHLGGIVTVPRVTDAFPDGVVSITVDDNIDTQYSVARPVLDAYGYPATAYTIMTYTDDSPDRITSGQLDKLVHLHGWEIGVHSYARETHTTTYPNMDPEALEEDFYRAKTWLQQRGLGNGESMAYPTGAYNQEVIAMARRYFTTGRSTFQWDNGQPMAFAGDDAYRLKSVGLSGTTDSSNWESLVNGAQAQGKWLILHGHSFHPTTPGVSTFSASRLDEVCGYIQSAGMPVMTIGDVVARLTR